MSDTNARGVVAAVRHGGSPLLRKGIALIVILTVILVALGLKNTIKVALRSGETIQAEFADADGLSKDKSTVKLAGLKVGVVTGIDHHEDGSSLVKMKVDKSALSILGSAPEARIEPLTILGGEFSVHLARGGSGTYDGATIPASRTGNPVELDRILEALPADTRAATQGLVRGLGDTLDDRGQESLRNLADVAPPVLRGSTTFLTAAQGTHPESDLQGIVTYLQDAAAVLAAQRTDVDGALTGLDGTSAAFARSSDEIARTVDRLPATLDHTEEGLEDLEETVEKLGKTAKKLRPTAEETEDLVEALGPLLVDARPVVAKLGPITQDAIPTVRNLIPTVRHAHGFLGEVGGPTIAKVRGPILDTLGKPWNGVEAGIPEYPDSGTGIQADNKFYEEIAFMLMGLGRAVVTQDQQGSTLNFQAGVGTGSVFGLPLEEALARLIPTTVAVG